MNEDAAILLVEVFDCSCVWVDFHGSRDGAGEFLVWEGDLRNLRLKGAGD